MASRSDKVPIGIVAGGGRLPAILIESLSAEGHPAVVVSISNHPAPELKQLATQFHQTSPGQIRKIIKCFVHAEVSDIVLIGSVAKTQLFHPMRFDTLAMKILARTKQRGDRALLRAIADTFEAHDLRVLDQRRYLHALLPESGQLTRRRIDKSVNHDIEYGMKLARQMATWDVGQTVVLKQGIVVAIEAVEGTDEAIRRGAKLAGSGIVVAKAAHPDHDFRFDVPTVGPETIELLDQVEAAALAIEAERAFVVDREQCIAIANAAKIAVIVHCDVS